MKPAKDRSYETWTREDWDTFYLEKFMPTLNKVLTDPTVRHEIVLELKAFATSSYREGSGDQKSRDFNSRNGQDMGQ